VGNGFLTNPSILVHGGRHPTQTAGGVRRCGGPAAPGRGAVRQARP
jgi:hypothetical protein